MKKQAISIIFMAINSAPHYSQDDIKMCRRHTLHKYIIWYTRVRLEVGMTYFHISYRSPGKPRIRAFLERMKENRKSTVDGITLKSMVL